MKRIWALILTVSFIFTVLPASAESGYDAFVYLFQTIFEGETPYTSDDYPELISQTEYLEDFGTDQVCIVTIILFGEANTVSVLGRND